LSGDSDDHGCLHLAPFHMRRCVGCRIAPRTSVRSVKAILLLQLGGKGVRRRPVPIKLVCPIGNYPIPPTPSITPTPYPFCDVRDTVDSYPGSHRPPRDSVAGCSCQTPTAQVPRHPNPYETVPVADRGRLQSSGDCVFDSVRDLRHA